MKIEKIEANKIKVSLSALDLIDMNINVKSLTPDSPRLHNFLYEIMEKVKAETGFNPYSGQVVVEATPHDDGITLTVTKLVLDEVPVKKRRPKNIRVSSHKVASKLTYSFSSFEDVCNLFLINNAEDFSSGKLYEYLENFYMVIPKNDSLQIHEFGDCCGKLSLSETFLAEHGKLHAKGESLVNMARGVQNLMN